MYHHTTGGNGGTSFNSWSLKYCVALYFYVQVWRLPSGAWLALLSFKNSGFVLFSISVFYTVNIYIFKNLLIRKKSPLTYNFMSLDESEGPKYHSSISIIFFCLDSNNENFDITGINIRIAINHNEISATRK